MNLIEDAWIPARRRSGTVERIAPWQLTDRYAEDPFVSLAAPRPDFNGVLVQFLIGLLQTCFAPERERAWRERLRDPPGGERLKDAFTCARSAFDLNGSGPRFMQDLNLEQEVLAMSPGARGERTKPVGDMLIDLPTGKTLRDNTDFFVKRGRVEALCLSCAATALFTLQTNAPSGGQGHRTGIRGGGPLTTLVVGESLWATCWLNVLPARADSDSGVEPSRVEPAACFPWLGPTRTSEGSRGTTPEDVDPRQVFWAMPRRIRLRYSEQESPCDLCSTAAPCTVREYWTKNLGTNYTGPWRHPLSPHFIGSDGAPSPLHPQPGGIGYRHWLGLVHSISDAKGSKDPAAVVERYRRADLGDSRLWAFGYDMDNMKARCWYDSTMPLLLCPEDSRDAFEYHVGALVRGADQMAFEVRNYVRKALFMPGSDAKGDLSFVSQRFWQETESHFFDALPRIRTALVEGELPLAEIQQWHRLLVQTAVAIFDDYSQAGIFEAADPKRIALAWRGLNKALHGKKIREVLGLPSPARKKAPSRQRKEG